jgi:hypothetical protein
MMTCLAAGLIDSYGFESGRVVLEYRKDYMGHHPCCHANAPNAPSQESVLERVTAQVAHVVEVRFGGRVSVGGFRFFMGGGLNGTARAVKCQGALPPPSPRAAGYAGGAAAAVRLAGGGVGVAVHAAAQVRSGTLVFIRVQRV